MRTPGGRGRGPHGAGSAKKRRGGAAARGTNAPQTAKAVVACVEIKILRRVLHAIDAPPASQDGRVIADK